MAQLVARLVRNEKVGGSNPPSSTTGRRPIRMSVFCMPGRVGAVPVVAVPLVFRAPDGPAAREARHPHFVRCRASKPGQAPPPPTSTAAWPSGPSGALCTCGAWCAVVSIGFVSTSYAVQRSPCLACCWPQRYKVRPAHAKRAKKGHFERAGRVLYRNCREEGCAGRVLYRICRKRVCWASFAAAFGTVTRP